MEVALASNYSACSNEASSRRQEMLRQIAEALDVPETTFVDAAHTDTEFDSAVEMMRLWYELGSAADRRNVLALARALVAAHQKL